jgi:hypothetical protein
MLIRQISVALSCVVVALCSTLAVAQQADTTRPSQRTFSASEEAARRKVFESKHWQEVNNEMKEWLSVQTAYNKEQIAQLETQLQQQADGMSADQLESFLLDMEAKLKVLMSSEMTQTRSWLKQYYTPQAQKKMAKRFGILDPVHMTASQLTEALQRFEDERGSRNQAQASFNQTRQQQIAIDRANQRANAQASERALDRASRSASRSSYPYASPYAPQRVDQRYKVPSAGARYSIGPWGGVWRSGL